MKRYLDAIAVLTAIILPATAADLVGNHDATRRWQGDAPVNPYPVFRGASQSWMAGPFGIHNTPNVFASPI